MSVLILSFADKIELTLYFSFQKLTKEVQTTLAEANKVAEETISAMRTVRSFANECGEAESYYSKLLVMFQLNKKQALAYACYMWSSSVSVSSCPFKWRCKALNLFVKNYLFIVCYSLGIHKVCVCFSDLWACFRRCYPLLWRPPCSNRSDGQWCLDIFFHIHARPWRMSWGISSVLFISFNICGWKHLQDAHVMCGLSHRI